MKKVQWRKFKGWLVMAKRLLLKKYIIQAKKEVKNWPEFKKAQMNIWCSEYIENEEKKKRRKNLKKEDKENEEGPVA